MFNQFWQQWPFFRVLICFLSGVLVAFFQVSIWYCIPLCLAVFILFWLLKDFLKIAFFLDVLVGFGIQALIFFTGYFQFALNQVQQDFRNSQLAKFDSVFIQPEAAPVFKPNKPYANIACKLFCFSNGEVKGKALQFIRIQVDTACCRYFPENGILVSRKELIPIPEPENLGDFDFKSYAARKAWFYQYRLKANEKFTLAKCPNSAIESIAISLTGRIRRHLYDCYGRTNKSGLLMALLYGEDDEIDKNLIQSYAATGTLHILAVSGMHVGLIYFLLGLIINPLKKGKGGKFFHAFLIIGFLWLYAILCGLGPSILRATIMITLMLLSGLIERTYHPVNSLFATAFLLLIINPNFIADAGFQLSFMAVLGLALFYQDLYLLWEPKYWISDQVWKMVSGSLAAQVCTVPFSLYYFHQFPTWFIPANILIVPLSTLLIYLGLLEVFLSVIYPPFASSLAVLISWLIDGMNFLATWISSWPCALIEGFWFDSFQWILFAGALLFFIILLYKLNPVASIGLLICCFLFQVSGLKNDIITRQKRQWISFASFGKTTWIWQDGFNAKVFLEKEAKVSLGLKQFTERLHLTLSTLEMEKGKTYLVSSPSGIFEIRSVKQPRSVVSTTKDKD